MSIWNRVLRGLPWLLVRGRSAAFRPGDGATAPARPLPELESFLHFALAHEREVRDLVIRITGELVAQRTVNVDRTELNALYIDALSCP